jgi:hypothetical protein
MIKLLIIVCCEVIMGNRGNISYSYEVGYVDDAKNYTVTLYTTKKYEVGDDSRFIGRLYKNRIGVILPNYTTTIKKKLINLSLYLK